MTAVRCGVLMLIAALACPAVRAQDCAPACGMAPVVSARLNRPQDFAPPVLVVVPRPPEEYLPKQSLLATGVGGRRQINVAELHRHQLALYSGERQAFSVPGLMGEVPVRVVSPRCALPPAEFNYGAVVFWGITGLCVLVSLLLLARVVASFQRR